MAENGIIRKVGFFLFLSRLLQNEKIKYDLIETNRGRNF